MEGCYPGTKPVYKTESGCKVVPAVEHATAAGWEQFRRWIGDESESMALAAAQTMEKTWRAARGDLLD